MSDLNLQYTGSLASYVSFQLKKEETVASLEQSGRNVIGLYKFSMVL